MTTPREAIAVTGIIAIFSIILIAISTIPSSNSLTGNSIAKLNKGSQQKFKTFDQIFDQIIPYDVEDFDYNMDGFLEYDDFTNMFEGKIACVKGKICDLNQDGYLDNKDKIIFDSIVRKIYDYDNNFVLDKRDIAIFIKVMKGEESAQDYFVYDLNHDSKLDKIDLDLLTRLIYS